MTVVLITGDQYPADAGTDHEFTIVEYAATSPVPTWQDQNSNPGPLAKLRFTLCYCGIGGSRCPFPETRQEWQGILSLPTSSHGHEISKVGESGGLLNVINRIWRLDGD